MKKARRFVHRLAPLQIIIIIKKPAAAAYKIDFIRGLKPLRTGLSSALLRAEEGCFLRGAACAFVFAVFELRVFLVEANRFHFLIQVLNEQRGGLICKQIRSVHYLNY